jgi:hypothetical protein
MFVEVDFDRPELMDSVVLECSYDQHKIRLKLEGLLESGQWKTLATDPEQSRTTAPSGLRGAAVLELKFRGIRYLLFYDFDFGAEDFRKKGAVWGITFLGERNTARLYRID